MAKDPNPGPFDSFTNIDNEIATIIQQLDTVTTDLNALMGQKSVGAPQPKASTGTSSQTSGQSERAFIQYPVHPQPPEESQGSSYEPKSADLYATLTAGTTKYDFTNGTVTKSDGTEFQMSGKLNGLSSDYVHSLYMKGDGKFWWYSPENNVGGVAEQFDEVRLNNVDVQTLYIYSKHHIVVDVAGSTSGTIGINDGIGPDNRERVTLYLQYNPSPDAYVVRYNEDITQSWSTLTLATPYDARNFINNGTSISQGTGWQDVSNAESATVMLSAEIGVCDVAIEVREAGFEDPYGLATVHTSYLDGWKQDNPQTISAGEQETYTFDEMPYNFIRFHARSETNLSLTGDPAGRVGVYLKANEGR